MMFKTLKRLNKLDDVTRFRLINAFVFAIGFNLFVPILIDLKGEYLVPWAISLFMIGEQLIVKTNRYMVQNFTISQIYRLGIFVHIILITTAFLYFINPLYMVILEGLLSIIVVGVFGAYTIKLNNYITDNYPKDMSEFQIIRNSTWADGLLTGLAITTILTYFFPVYVALICFIVYNSCFTLWMIYNWNFYSNRSL